MTQEIIKKTLPIFYTVIFLVFIVGGILLYRIDEEQKNRLLTIEENLDVQAVGENVQLELNDQNKHEQVTYEVDDENVVKVDSEGNLVSVGEGSTEVTIKSKDSDKQQTIIVNVGKEAIKEYKEEQIKNSIISTNNKKTTTNNVKTTTPTDIKKTTIIKDKTTTSSPLSTTISNKKTTTTNKPTTKSQATTTTSNKATTNKSSTTSQPTTTKPSSGGSSKPSNVNKNIAVTGVSLNQVLGQIHLNTNSKTLTLVANISPSNATNKKIIWTSGNENIATVSNGVVTAKNPGVVTITARTEDGGKVASAQITVKKNVIIVIGASQVTRMAWYKNSYSSARYNYNTADNTLVYIHKGSSGIDYQTSEGFNIAKDYISNVSKTGKLK